MIRKAKFKSFKGLRDLSLTFEPFTVLVGPNGCGKSTVLRGLDLLTALKFMTPKQLFLEFGDAHQWLSRGKSWPLELEMDADMGSASTRLRICVEGIVPGPTFAETHCTIRVDATLPYHNPPAKALSSDTERLAEAFPEFAAQMPSSVRLGLIANQLAEPSYFDGPTPYLQFDGGFLPSVLSYMTGSMPEAFRAVEDSVRAIVPTLKRIRVLPAQISRREPLDIQVEGKPVRHERVQAYWGHRVLLDFDSASDIPAREASEGTLLVLGILTAMLGPQEPRLLLLDDLDRGLHPRAQGDLVGQLRKLLAQYRNLQIIATSHSPYLLDHFKPHEVRLLYEASPGDIHCAALTEHPEFDRWKDAMRPGEFWSTIGEQWIAELAGQHAP
ncbi:MAG: AAA family ATPase [Planctomycetes bacterium]|nr:AAA family ATPase [Planctomycetota bacterium]